MKKTVRILLCLSLCLCLCLSFFARPVHVHALEVGDPCPTVTAICSGHMIKQYVSELMASTCLEAASYRLVCDTCGYSDREVYYDPLGPHEYDELTVQRIDASCTAGGTRFLICRNCKHQDTETIPALGHANVLTASVEPSCTEEGRNDYRCTRCGTSSSVPVDALGHSFPDDSEPAPITGTDSPVAANGKEPGCTEEGYKEKTCTRCGYTEREPIPALGHDYVPSQLQPTCTEEGYDLLICSRCGEESGEHIPPLGHDFVLSESTEPGCTEEGSKLYYCSACSEQKSETVPPTGHRYQEDDWRTEKEATIFHEGLKTHECTVCGEPEEAPIPKADPTPAIIAGGAAVGLGAGIGALIAFFKKRAAKKAAEAAAAKAALELGRPSIQTRTVLLASLDEDFITFLKLKKYINAKTCDVEELEQGIADNEPNVIILDLNRSFTLDDFAALPYEDQQYAFIVSDKVLPDVEDELKQLKKDKKIVGYAPKSAGDWVKLVKLFLPIAKPELTSDEGLENIGMVSDALGIPFISGLISAYTSARDIKSTMDGVEDEMGVTDAAVIVSDIASILGLDTLASVSGLVDDIATIKDSLTSEANAATVTDGYDAGADIVDVVGELLDKK